MSDEKPSFTNVFAAPAIMECRDHSMNFYKGGPNTVLSSAFPPLPVVKKAGGMSYTKKSTLLGGNFEASVSQSDYCDPRDWKGARVPKKVKRFIRGSKQGNKKMEKLGYSSQVGNVVFNQGAPASIAVGSTKKISGRTEMNSSFTGQSSTKRDYMWPKDTSDGFKSFSTKKKGKVVRTGMTHPKANTGTRPERQHYTAIRGVGVGEQAPLSLTRRGAGPRLGTWNSPQRADGMGFQYEH